MFAIKSSAKKEEQLLYEKARTLRAYRCQLLSPDQRPFLVQFTRMNVVDLKRPAIFTKFSTQSRRDKVAFDPRWHYGDRMRK